MNEKKFEEKLLALREAARELKERGELGYFNFSLGNHVLDENKKTNDFIVVFKCPKCNAINDLIINRLVFEVKCPKCNKRYWKMSGKISRKKKKELEERGLANKEVIIREN